MAVVTVLPKSQPLTRADLDAMPDDGHRYELIDGALLVTPAPSQYVEVGSVVVEDVVQDCLPWVSERGVGFSHRREETVRLGL